MNRTSKNRNPNRRQRQPPRPRPNRRRFEAAQPPIVVEGDKGEAEAALRARVAGGIAPTHRTAQILPRRRAIRGRSRHGDLVDRHRRRRPH
jgi:hypothetical protein